MYNTHTGLIFAYQLITLPFTIWMLRSFFQEIPLEIQEAAKIDGCSWLGVLTRVILPLSMPGISVTVILGFIFSWNAFNYPLMLAGRQTFPVTVGAIQFISYEQVLWGQMAAATIVAALPQLVLSLMVQNISFAGSPWARCDRRDRWSRRALVQPIKWMIVRGLHHRRPVGRFAYTAYREQTFSRRPMPASWAAVLERNH